MLCTCLMLLLVQRSSVLSVLIFSWYGTSSQLYMYQFDIDVVVLCHNIAAILLCELSLKCLLFASSSCCFVY
jgi:hypothetical protein